MTKPIIFLDIDNVICTERAYHAYRHATNKYVMRAWDPMAVKLVSNLCQDFDCEVVITSTWANKHDVPTILLSHGFIGNFHTDEKARGTKMSYTTRGHNIRDWLEDHPEIGDKYLILDDDESGDGIKGTDQEDHTVFCHILDGMTLENYLKARKILHNYCKKQ